MQETSARLCVRGDDGVKHCMPVKRGEMHALPEGANEWAGVYVSPFGSKVCCASGAQCSQGSRTFPAGGGCFEVSSLSRYAGASDVELILEFSTPPPS